MQTREIVSNVAKFMKSEADTDWFLIDVKKLNARVSAATGVSERTVTRIKSKRKKIEESSTSFETPNKNRILPKRVTGLDNFNLGVVRRIVDNFYLIEKQLPTLKGIQEKCDQTLILQDLKAAKTKINKKILTLSRSHCFQALTVFVTSINSLCRSRSVKIRGASTYIRSVIVINYN
ncbi:hypothetical protein J6590_017469 [Homalodisca vitripennis]|nr:hypothetical protein J6590_017469 [Homalodisca vitripennis]